MNEIYTINIVETSRELTKKERVQLKTNAATKLDELISTAPGESTLVLEGITGYAVLEIHNPKAVDNKDYKHYVILTEENGMFYTGSETFFNRFRPIWEEMAGEKDWGLECVKVPARKYPGKHFLSCNLV